MFTSLCGNESADLFLENAVDLSEKLEQIRVKPFSFAKSDRQWNRSRCLRKCVNCCCPYSTLTYSSPHKGLIYDGSGLGSEVESVGCIRVKPSFRGNVGNHTRMRRSTQGILKDITNQLQLHSITLSIITSCCYTELL